MTNSVNDDEKIFVLFAEFMVVLVVSYVIR